MNYTHFFNDIQSEKWNYNFSNVLINEGHVKSLRTQSDLFSLVSEKLTDKILIDGGHYPLEQHGKQIYHKPNTLTSFVFDFAVKIYISALKKNLNPSLAFLINDMGLDNNGRLFIKKEFRLHPAYKEILNYNGLDFSDISLVFFESNLRNRSSKFILKNGLKRGFVKENETLLYVPDISDTNKEASFANFVGCKKITKTGVHYVPFCRGIMAQKFLISEAGGYNQIISLITENEFKCFGEFAKVYHVFGGTCKVLNILFSKLELTDKIEHTYNNKQHQSSSQVYYLNSDPKYFVQIQNYEPN